MQMARKAARITGKEMAEALGVQQSVLSKWEHQEKPKTVVWRAAMHVIHERSRVDTVVETAATKLVASIVEALEERGMALNGAR